MSPDSSPQREECPVTSDDLDVPDSALRSYGIESWSCSRPAWEPEATGSSRCVWHTETAEKPPNELKNEIHDGDLHGAIAPHTDLTSLELPPAPGFVDAGFSKADLEGADLSDAYLWEADLSEANLKGADLSDAYLWEADLSGADLREADLSEAHLRFADLRVADLREADLSEAHLRFADLSGANLKGADLSEAHLRGADLSAADLLGADLSAANLGAADLSGAGLRKADLSAANLRRADLSRAVLGNTNQSNINISNRTRFTRGFIPKFGPALWQIGFTPRYWNGHAQDCHKLATKCSKAGLRRNARILTVWDRRARRIEALFSMRVPEAVGSWLNWQATGHGISLRRITRNIVALYIISTTIYLLFGIQSSAEAIPINVLLSRPFLTPDVVDTLYFSIVTFTTSPPVPMSAMSVGISKWVAMAETFLGTALIVFLGYVLGTRERV